ncbi:ABC transporter permease [Mangrovimicrobium sediminis]|uniref:ABC transporter permease n=1 Tax=Mangrovimicrobium sediminis TaxID=2562682 RepID=A0A4Z0LWQ7_9GAMM|nr:FtsX-like permease family protein [Haliea sp. SAOS-164]TGD71843.1 ABC transporter permease [Haliea sp. SAOS-164]
MNLTWVLAWRNLWRHRRRTWLTVGAMLFCNVLLVFLISLQLGSYQVMIDNSLALFSGHLQVQQADYRADQRLRDTVPQVTALAEEMRGQLDAVGVAARGQAFALASSEERSFGIQITGVQPAYEPLVSSLPGLVAQGRYLQPDDSDAIVVGAVLARNLRVAPGDALTFIGSGRDGSIAAGIATVVGILDSGIPEVDRGMAQVPLAWFQDVFAMGEAGHAVVVRMAHLEQVQAAVATTRGLLPAEENLAVLDWDALQPGLRQAIQSDMASAWFMYAVLILLVAFSVLNTQLMSVMERTHEFGVMLALGLGPGRLARLVAMETMLLSLLGLALGLLCGALLVAYLSVAGFTYPGMEELAARFNMAGRIYPEFSVVALTWGPLVVFVFCLLAAIYPALSLFRLAPVSAMRAAR